MKITLKDRGNGFCYFCNKLRINGKPDMVF